MRRNRICSGTLACLIAWAALAVSVMAAEDTGSTMRVLEVKEAEQVLVRVIAADGTTITGEIGMLSWSQQNMGEDLAAEQQQRTEPAGPFVAQATGEESASSVFDPQPSPTPFLSFFQRIHHLFHRRPVVAIFAASGNRWGKKRAGIERRDTSFGDDQRSRSGHQGLLGGDKRVRLLGENKPAFF